MLYRISNSQKAMQLRNQNVYTVLMYGTKTIPKKRVLKILNDALSAPITGVRKIKDHKRQMTKYLVEATSKPSCLD